MAVAGFIVDFGAGMALSRVGACKLMAIGLFFTAAASALFALVDVKLTYWAMVFPIMLLIPFADIVDPVGSLQIMSHFDADSQSLAGGVYNVAMRLGTSLGLAITSTISTTISENFAKTHNVLGTSPEALEAGFRAAGWTCFATTVCAMLIAVGALRGIGIVGKHTPEEFVEHEKITFQDPFTTVDQEKGLAPGRPSVTLTVPSMGRSMSSFASQGRPRYLSFDGRPLAIFGEPPVYETRSRKGSVVTVNGHQLTAEERSRARSTGDIQVESLGYSQPRRRRPTSFHFAMSQTPLAMARAFSQGSQHSATAPNISTPRTAGGRGRSEKSTGVSPTSASVSFFLRSRSGQVASGETIVEDPHENSRSRSRSTPPRSLSGSRERSPLGGRRTVRSPSFTETIRPVPFVAAGHTIQVTMPTPCDERPELDFNRENY
jgi:hypothetical protein